MESKKRDPPAEDTVLPANLEEENAESPPIPTQVLLTSIQDIDLQLLLLVLTRQASPCKGITLQLLRSHGRVHVN